MTVLTLLRTLCSLKQQVHSHSAFGLSARTGRPALSDLRAKRGSAETAAGAVRATTAEEDRGLEVHQAEKYLLNLPLKEVGTWDSFFGDFECERGIGLLKLLEAASSECVWVRGDSTITSQCSNVSRMEAVFVREQTLKLNQHVGHIKRPTDLIRHLEDFSKSEANLSNFTEMKLSEADRCSVLLQSLSAEVRQYVVLHGSSSDWEALRKASSYGFLLLVG
eukprot:s9812_g2.t1